MFCPSCGTKVQREGQRFCTSCGIALVDTAVHEATEAVPTTAPGATAASDAAADTSAATAATAATAAPTAFVPLAPLTPLAPASPAAGSGDPTVPVAAPAAATPNLPPPAAPAEVAAAAPTVPVDALAAVLRDNAAHQPTTALTVVEQTGYTAPDEVWRATAPGVHPPESWAADPTPAATAVLEVTPTYAEPTGPQPFRITPLVAVSTLAAVLAVASALVDVASWEVTGSEVNSFAYRLNDFASNYLVGTIIAAVLLLAGAAAGATGRRIGTGLAGGTGLALAGMVAMMVAQVTAAFDAKDVEYVLRANADSGFSYTLTVTHELGFWLAVVAAALGVVAFVLSILTGSGPDGRAQVSAVITVIGAVATLLVVVGTLIPMEGAQFADQFANDFTPPATLLLRLLVLVLIAVGGFTGFVNSRRWGLGLALGTISIGVWQWATAITESGDIPLGIAGGNLGAPDFAPHILTSVGVVVMVLCAVVGLLINPRATEALPAGQAVPLP